MSTPDRIAQLERCGVSIYLDEPAANHAPQAEAFTVTLGVGGSEVELDLCAIRRAKQVLAEGERRLLLRQQQAVLRRNLTLDLPV
ncbi:hypothetical protein D3C71_21740 [compost metagenome]